MVHFVKPQLDSVHIGTIFSSYYTVTLSPVMYVFREWGTRGSVIRENTLLFVTIIMENQMLIRKNETNPLFPIESCVSWLFSQHQEWHLTSINLFDFSIFFKKNYLYVLNYHVLIKHSLGYRMMPNKFSLITSSHNQADTCRGAHFIWVLWKLFHSCRHWVVWDISILCAEKWIR